MNEFNFEKLDVYYRSLNFIDLVYELTKLFLKEKLYALTNQLIRAAGSVALNIGGGAGSTDKNLIIT